MKPIISIIKKDDEVQFIFDNEKAVILGNSDIHDTCLLIEDFEDDPVLVKGFHFIGVGKWRWRLLWFLIRLLSQGNPVHVRTDKL